MPEEEAATGLPALLRARVGDSSPGYLFDDETWTWDEVVAESAARGAAIRELIDPSRPPHLGVLLENSPEVLFWIGGASLAGAAIVPVNPTRRGAELQRDIAHTGCQWLITDSTQLAQLDGVDLAAIGLAERVIVLDETAGHDLVSRHHGATMPVADPDPGLPLLLLFTSGSTSAPKAVICSSRRLAQGGLRTAPIFGLTSGEVAYACMPMFHGNVLMACWSPALAGAATVAIRRRFSASGFLPDVRRYGITFFTYVGRTIAYLLAQPPSPEDRDHRLRLGFGTEASPPDRQRFTERFGCPLIESYGFSEGTLSIARTPDTPPAALGVPADPTLDVAVVDPATGVECEPARFDDSGRLLNAGATTGEIVSRNGLPSFEGYYNNPEATAERLRDGWYWTGDLAFRDEDGYFYFAGRAADKIRVDSENFSSAPIENILARYPAFSMVAVYPVPDPQTGDQVMAAVELLPGTTFDPVALGDWLVAQPDLGPKWAPRFLRITDEIPLTANRKVYKPPLRNEAWACDDPVWWRPPKGRGESGPDRYIEFTSDDRQALADEFAAHHRMEHLPS
jgi:fatty-acyl-CoA synthase